MFRIFRKITLAFLIALLLYGIIIYFSVEQWSSTAEGKLPAKTAVLLHAVNSNIVTPDIKVPKFLTPSSGSSIIRENIKIPVSDGEEINARVYRPNREGPFPIVLYYHGGAFMEGYGNIDTHDNIVRALSARTQSVVVAVGYRVAPAHVFPTAIEDSYDALVWINNHADDFNGDPTRMAVAGDSAGGNIATVVAAMARDREGPALTAQILYYPLTTFQDVMLPSRSIYDSGYYLLSRRVMYLARDKYTPEEEMWSSPYTSPLDAEDLSGLPPALIITAEFDPLRDEGEVYGKRLKEAGVPVQALRYNGVMHGFVSFYEVMNRGNHGLNQSATFLRKAFHTEADFPAYTFEVIDIPNQKEKWREQMEAYAIAGFLLGKQTLSFFPVSIKL